AASGDGGVVLSIRVFNFFAQQGALIKLDANGRAQWQADLPVPALELQASAGGEITALSFGDETRVTRLSAAGSVLWEKRISSPEPAAHLTTMVALADGGVVLAGTGAGAIISLVRLGSDGALVSAQDIGLRSLSAQ